MEFTKKLFKTNITRKYLVSDMLKRGGIIIGLVILVLSLAACNNKNNDTKDDETLSITISASVNMFNGSNTINIQDSRFATTQKELIHFLTLLRNAYNLAAASEEGIYWTPLVGIVNYIEHVNLLDFHTGDGVNILLENELTNNDLTNDELAGNISLQVVEEHHTSFLNIDNQDVFKFTKVHTGYLVEPGDNFKIENLVFPSFYKGVVVSETGNFSNLNIKHLTLPRYIQKIRDAGFENNQYTTQIVLENLPYLKHIPQSTFKNLRWEKVVLRNLPNLNQISYNAFERGNSKNLEIVLENLPNLLDLGSNLFAVNNQELAIVRNITFKNVNPNPEYFQSTAFFDASKEVNITNKVYLLDYENITPSWWDKRFDFFGPNALFFNDSGIEIFNNNY